MRSTSLSSLSQIVHFFFIQWVSWSMRVHSLITTSPVVTQCLDGHVSVWVIVNLSVQFIYIEPSIIKMNWIRIKKELSQRFFIRTSFLFMVQVNWIVNMWMKNNFPCEKIETKTRDNSTKTKSIAKEINSNKRFK